MPFSDMKNEEVKPGIYRHFKNILVRVIGVALDSETKAEYVVYEKMEDYGDYKKGSLWIRPKSMFTENITRNGKIMPRFTFVSRLGK